MNIEVAIAGVFHQPIVHQLLFVPTERQSIGDSTCADKLTNTHSPTENSLLPTLTYMYMYHIHVHTGEGGGGRVGTYMYIQRHMYNKYLYLPEEG